MKSMQPRRQRFDVSLFSGGFWKVGRLERRSDFSFFFFSKAAGSPGEPNDGLCTPGRSAEASGEEEGADFDGGEPRRGRTRARLH